MSLRTKLVLSFAMLLLAVIAGFGIVASSSLDRILIGQADRLLAGFGERAALPGPGGFPSRPGSPTDQGSNDTVLRRDVAELWVNEAGEVLVAHPSGFADDPDPLPDHTQIVVENKPTTIPSVDGTMRYRAIAIRQSEGVGSVVIALSLSNVEAANEALIGVLVLSGLGVLLIGGAATWATVDRAMRPVAEMVDTAEAIAGGDLTRRVPEREPATELGRLGVSLNEMLHTIETALDHEREAQARLRRFIADASHELRTPITVISGYTELRNRGGLEEGEAEDNAWDRIGAESRRMANLVEDLITLTRAGQVQTTDPERVDIVSIVRDVVADHVALDQERPVSVDTPDELLIWADRERVHQVLSNLLANARTHTPPGTTVSITVARVADSLELAVEDDGPGIPEEALEHVFDRFYRADSSRSRRSGGSGLGLAIAKAIVEAHGGSITVANSPGALFQVTLPIERPRD